MRTSLFGSENYYLVGMFQSSILAVVVACLVTFVIGVLILITKRWHGRWTYDHFLGIQKFHSQPTPRVGGIAIVVGVFFSGFIQEFFSDDVILFILISGLIPFCFGLAEDLTNKVSVRARLLATIASVIFVICQTGLYLNRIDVSTVDYVISWWPVAAFLTVFSITGVTNSINILDGFNGLASGSALIILLFLSYIAFGSDDTLLGNVSLILAGSLLGFMLLNYPLGKIFLGDSGAYFLGFLVAWISLLLPLRNEEISPWASLLTCAYPVTEVLYSIYRRVRTKCDLGQPDNLHMHTLIKVNIVDKYFKPQADWVKNSLVAPGIWLCSVFLGIAAINYADNTPILILILLGFFINYHLIYLCILRLPVARHRNKIIN